MEALEFKTVLQLPYRKFENCKRIAEEYGHESLNIGDEIRVELNWHTGGRACGEYLDTFHGTLFVDEKKYTLYCHWSDSGLIGIYPDEERVDVIGLLRFNGDNSIEILPYKVHQLKNTIFY